MRFVLVHGWGFHPGIFDPLIAHLPDDAEVSRVDLGFVAGGGQALSPSDEWPQDAIAVGHSLGVLWLLHERRRNFRGLVSLQGFDRFAAHVGMARVRSMQKALSRDPLSLMQMFWQSCGVPDFAPAEALRQERLAEGLDWLMQWEETEARESLKAPVLALASKDDPIVPQAMSDAIWGDAVVWSAEAGHALPLRHPKWCAEKILEFSKSIDG
ncbi:alpha/beta fold hydrolase [Methyloligella sp. 2.7D]|uniref:alpha/beta fold hydrolase n=1 Tax=unclassified Methyloligella TaxID=2625955 RepID=UPI00157D2D07|nr:alpha/beta fold hydrolase [Methyloligella sp. GL2]QKP77908.1 hypothetical protein HT051_10905 [Methyloligella sp. GL2]